MSSSKQEFNKAALREQIIQKWSDKEEDLRKSLEEQGSAYLLRLRRNVWREAAEERVLVLAERLKAGEVEDSEISGFNVPFAPDASVDKYEVRRTSQELDEIPARREKYLGRLDALRDREGFVTLTQTQLREFLGL